MSDGWYVSRANQVFGPYSWERALEFAREGSIGADDLVMRPGSREWVPAAAVPAFISSAVSAAAMVSEAPTPRPPAAPQQVPTPIPPVEPPLVSVFPDSEVREHAPRRRGRGRFARVLAAIVLTLAVGAAAVWFGPGMLPAPKGTFTPPSAGHVAKTKAYGNVQVNRIVVSLTDGASEADVEQLAKTLGGSVVGKWSHLGLFLIEFPNETEAGLASALKTASGAKGIASALPDKSEQP